MNQDESARDPYVRLNQHISRRAAGEQHPTYTIGKVLSLDPVKIRADGIDLEKEDLRVAESLYPNFHERPGGMTPDEDIGIRTRLPEAHFPCSCGFGMGVAIRPEEYVTGATKLSVDDEVLLMRSNDGQTYYLIDRMVAL